MRADAVVVGSGPAGAAVAKTLVDGGLDVLMLEAGARPEANRFAVMERALLGNIPWDSEPYPHEMVGDDVELDVFAIRRLGGSSLAWGAVTPRFHASDFELRSRHGVGVDWPLRYEDLEPWYGRAERLMGVSGAADNAWASPRSTPFPMGAFPMSDADLLVKGAAAKLGVAMHSVPVARNSVPYDGRSACSSYSVCRACPTGAMYSSDQTIARLERGPRFRVLTRAEASRVELDARGRTRRVVWLDEAASENAVDAPVVILATQAVENVRLLLASACARHPHGLGNAGGALGRGFIEHPKFYVRGRVRQRLSPYQRGFETAGSSQFHDHAFRGERAGARLLVRENAGPSPAMIAMESGRFGAALRDEVRELFGRHVVLGAFLEQLPRENNRIVLSNAVRRRDGSPAARVEFTLLSEYERSGFEALRAVMFDILATLGAEDIEVALPPSNSGHYMGGHRMGLSPADSVTDTNLQVHGVPGLFLAGAGAFPTSGVANPTLTTVALSLRMADHVVRHGAQDSR